MKSFVHTNYPIQVCSLTTGNSGSWSSVCRSVVTKPRDGKSRKGGLIGSQSGEANQQVAGKRTTEGIVKVTHQELLSEMGMGGVECALDARRPKSTGKKMDTSTCGSPGVKGGDMLGKRTDATGESPCDYRESGISRSIRRNAESWSEVAWEVGDVHSSEDVSATKTALCKGTLACRGMKCNEMASDECGSAQKHPESWAKTWHGNTYYITVQTEFEENSRYCPQKREAKSKTDCNGKEGI